MTLYFDLNAFGKGGDGETADEDLLRLVSRQLASYYLAVPLAGEDNRVTVATAYPDNADALLVLRRLLRADVVPVSSTEDDLEEAIARIYPAPAPAGGPILAWSDDPAGIDAVVAAANAFSGRSSQPVVILDASASLDEVLERAGYDFSLLAARVSDEASMARLVFGSPVSLLLVRGEFAPIDHMLVALRGFGSDREILDRVLPFLAQGGAATVLPLARAGAARLDLLPVDQSAARRHLRDFLRDLDRTNVRVDVRLCQGDPVSQVVNEMAQGRYAMLVIAAEGEGRFVWRVLSRMEQDGVWGERPVLVIKPPVRLPELDGE